LLKKAPAFLIIFSAKYFKIMNRSVFLLLTDKDSAISREAFVSIRSGITDSDKAYILFHQKKPEAPAVLGSEPLFMFTYDSLGKLGYIPVARDILPGSNHFPVLQFFLNFPDFQYYWVIEDDVRFNGDWEHLFGYFDSYDHDFISSHFRRFEHEPKWLWWEWLCHPKTDIPIGERIRSFNPIYRISGKALRYLHTALSDNWIGHHEVLIPSLLYHHGFKVLDFGGEGEFVAKGNNNLFYTSAISDLDGQLREGTMRYRPVWENPGSEFNKIYHPVKYRVDQ
jgi:hypothetical protein